MAKLLLVIGNGFDINLNLKSTYKEYLESDIYLKKRDRLENIYDKVKNLINNERPSKFYNLYRDKNDIFGELNFWDLFFGLSKVMCLAKELETWSDFERYLYEFLRDDGSAVHIRKILAYADKSYGYFGYDGRENDYLIILYIYLVQKRIVDEKKHINYYELLNELKKFEKKFGDYIKCQSSKEGYLEDSRVLIEKLVGKENELGGIDTFNYSEVPSKDGIVWHINGDTDNPIFGIDDDFWGKDIRDFNFDNYIFTKTYRRLEQYGERKDTPKHRQHTGVVVYGHSLNEQDYNYYYPLFNQLDFTITNKSSNDGKYIVFKYSVFGDKSPEERREEIIKAVIKMLLRYNDEILKEPHFRLIDILFNQNRIRFEEVLDDKKLENK